MGASKEGMMSVREKMKIDLAFHPVSLEEEDDPPDRREATCQTFQEEGGVRTESCGEKPPGVGGSGGSRMLVGSSGNSVINSLSSGQVHSQLEGVQVLGETNVEILQAMVMDNFYLIQNLKERLKEMESNFEIIKTEKRNVESVLVKERQRYEELELKANARDTANADKVAEMAKELSARPVKPVTCDRSTCVTPPPTIPPDPVCENSIYEFEPPANKRARFGDAGSTPGSLLRRDVFPQVRPIPIPGFSRSPPQMSPTSNNSHQGEESVSSHTAQQWPQSRVPSVFQQDRLEGKRRITNDSTFKPQSASSNWNDLKSTMPFHLQPVPSKPGRRFLNFPPVKKSIVIPRRSLPFNIGHNSVGTSPSNSLTPSAGKRKVGRPPGSVKSKTSPILPQPSTSPTVPNGIVLETPCSAPPPPQKFSRSGRLIKPNRNKFSPEHDSSPTPTPSCASFRKSYPCDDTEYQGEELISPSTLRQGENDFDGESGFADDIMDIDKPDEDYDDNEEDDDTVPDSASKAFVEVPKWRIVEIDDLSESDEDTPMDDMSEEAYMKRHQKLEAKEKQRKRWDAQRMRDETYRENMKRKAEERERQRELRKQRKKNKGRTASEEETEESVMPCVDDIKAIYIGDDLPVGAFGHPIPLVEKVNFCLSWSTALAVKEPVAPTPPPSNDEKKSDSDKNDTEDANRIPTPVVNSLEEVTSTSPTTQQPSSPSSSSLSLPSIPSPGKDTPPPIIFPEYGDNDEEMDTCDGGNTTEKEANHEAAEEESKSTNVITSTLAEPEAVASEIHQENCDKSSAPIPVPPPEENANLPAVGVDIAPENNLCCDETRPNDDTPSRVKDLRPRTSAVVRFPQVGFPSSSSTRPCLSSSPSVSKERIPFFIPNNPLAPRQRSSISPGQAKSSSSTSSVQSSSSHCKDS